MLIGPFHRHKCSINYPIGQLGDFLLPPYSLAKYYHWIRYGKVNLVTCFLWVGLLPAVTHSFGFQKEGVPGCNKQPVRKNGKFQQEVQSGGVPSGKSISEKSENWCVS